MSVHQLEQEDFAEASFDSLMARLLVLTTHYTLSGCDKTLRLLVERIERLCSHAEIEFYPDQHRILCKMHQLWQYKLFQINYCPDKSSH